ncbi:unnamed protein product [Haemonchus placei]|uniref:Major sperm protein n=1 Tax=Haemonchus placei TaxID=6290 RepID=A0A0N4W8Q7_HAEPC|nr:unnamed protein product [Haemonchus placei]
MIYLSVYLILPFLPYIYFAVQSGGKKKKDTTKKSRKKHSSKKDKKKEKKEKGKKEEKKEDEKKEEKKDEKKEGENKDEQKNEEGEKEGEKKGDEKDEEKEKDKNEEELPLDVTMPSESKEEPPAPGDTKKGIKLSPSSLAWEPKASKQVLKVTNATEEKQAMKIKCSNNAIFRCDFTFLSLNLEEQLWVKGIRTTTSLKTVHPKGETKAT